MALRLRIKELAEARGETAGSLSRKADINISTIRRMWHNTTSGSPKDARLTSVDLNALEAIARALGVAPGELIEQVPDD